MKARINLGFTHLSVPEKIMKARHLVSNMTGNSNFTTPIPSLASITTAIATLEAAYDVSLEGSRAQKWQLRDKVVIVDNMVAQLVSYIELIAGGNEIIALSSGLPIRTKGGKKAASFSAKDGLRTGELILQTKASKNSSYVWESLPDPLFNSLPPSDQNWQYIGTSIKASIIASNLKTGMKYWFRYATISKTGRSNWSNPISRIAGV